jgi:molybdate transport system substrate-binding protein
VRLPALVAALALAAGCGGEAGGDARPLTVSAAASLKTALTAHAEPSGARLSFAGSDELAAQIRRGLRPDVFVASDSALPRALHDEGLVEAPVAVATNELVLAVPADSEIASLDDLRGDDRLAAGAPGVPVGEYARAVIAGLPPARARELRGAVRSEEPDVSGIVAKLTQGAVDAGFVYRTDVAAAAARLRAVALPERLRPEVVYAAAVVRGAPRAEEARRFVLGLRDASELRDAGFGPPP